MFLKNASDNNSATIIFVILLILCLSFLFENTFNKKNFNKIRSIPYERDESQHFKNMPYCYNIVDPLEQYLLVDYYIASSFNTPLIGNQKNDFLSLQMLSKVIEAGARYIELEICKSDISDGAPPVIAMGDKVGDWIISANSLQAKDVFNLISRKAFKFISGSINYPLIIYLKINTKDTITLNSLANIIKSAFGNLLLENSAYFKKPVFLERMCKLLNKIIVLADENYNYNNLKDIVIPSQHFINYIKYNEIDSLNGVPQKGEDSKIYNNILSGKKQKDDHNYFKQKYPSINNKDFEIGSNVLDKFKKDKNIIDLLTQFNKVGITVVAPHNDEDVFSMNFPFENQMAYGCQCIAMNYQVFDDHLANYMKFFKDSSFKLKPAGLRFHRQRKDVVDLTSMFKYKENPTIQVESEFLKEFDNKLITIESLQLPGYFLTIRAMKANFEIGKRDSKNELLPPNNNQMFIVNRSRYRKIANGITIRPLVDSRKALITDGDFFYFDKIGNSAALVADMTIFPIKSMCQRKDYVSFATVPSKNINVMAVHKYTLKEYRKSKEDKLATMGCFKIREVEHEKYIVFKHLTSGKYIKALKDGTVILSGTKITPNHKFLLSGNFRSTDENTGEQKKVTLGTPGNTFLGQNDINLVDTKSSAISKNTLINIIFDGTAWNILNQDRFLSSLDDKTLSFNLDKPLLTPEKRDKKNRVTQVAIYGPTLGNKKRFQIQELFEPK